MRRFALLLIAASPLLAGASVPVGTSTGAADPELTRARAEARAADAELRRLEQAAVKARGKAAQLAAQRQAAAAAIAASEAEISAADAQLRRAEARVAEQSRRLAERQAPAAALLAGMVSMGRRPPLLSIADSSSLDEFVRVRTLLDGTLPVIRAQSAALAGELEKSRRLRAGAAAARNQLAASRSELERRRQRFARLEITAIEQAARIDIGATGAADMLAASSESEARIQSEAERRRSGLRLAAAVGGLPPAPPRPGTEPPPAPPLAYILPVSAPLSVGLGSVGETGIRSRGITLLARRGTEVRVPGDGAIAFAGPFRRHDGVVIIDHGRGWLTLMTGVRTDLVRGTKVRAGAPLGRALGPVTVELSTNGAHVSAAIIARSSQIVSNRAKSG